MADPLPEPGLNPSSHDDADATHSPGPTAATPRWMRMLWVVVVVGVLALVIVLHVTGTLGPGAH